MGSKLVIQLRGSFFMMAFDSIPMMSPGPYRATSRDMLSVSVPSMPSPFRVRATLTDARILTLLSRSCATMLFAIPWRRKGRKLYVPISSFMPPSSLRPAV